MQIRSIHIWDKLRRKLCTLERTTYLPTKDSTTKNENCMRYRYADNVIVPWFSLRGPNSLCSRAIFFSRWKLDSWNSTTGWSMVVILAYTTTCLSFPPTHKHNRSEMVAVLGPFEALPYYIHTYPPTHWIQITNIKFLKLECLKFYRAQGYACDRYSLWQVYLLTFLIKHSSEICKLETVIQKCTIILFTVFKK
jgi:hypothetical protein